MGTLFVYSVSFLCLFHSLQNVFGYDTLCLESVFFVFLFHSLLNVSLSVPEFFFVLNCVACVYLLCFVLLSLVSLLSFSISLSAECFGYDTLCLEFVSFLFLYHSLQNVFGYDTLCLESVFFVFLFHSLLKVSLSVP